MKYGKKLNPLIPEPPQPPDYIKLCEAKGIVFERGAGGQWSWRAGLHDGKPIPEANYYWWKTEVYTKLECAQIAYVATLRQP